MLVPLVCCISIQQVDAKVIYSPDKTNQLMENIKNATNNNNDDYHKNFASLLSTWYKNDDIFYAKTIQMPGIAAFVPSQRNNAIYNVKVYVGWKFRYNPNDPNTEPPNNMPINNDITPLFGYTDYSHTERQLAIQALLNANNQGNHSIDTNQIIKTDGTLHIFTPYPPCTNSKNFHENGGMLCVDYYAHLLQNCPNIKIHVYCNKKFINSLSQEVLENVNVAILLNAMSPFLQKITGNQNVKNSNTIQAIKQGTLAKRGGSWCFSQKNSNSSEIEITSIYENTTYNIKNDIMNAIKEYIRSSNSTEELAFSEKILTTLIQLILKQRHCDQKKNDAINRLTMHLITPIR